MIRAEIQRFWRQLQDALHLSLICGQVSLNINNGDLESWDVKEHFRAPKENPLDKYKTPVA